MSIETPELPDDNSREAIEARLTALLLGELSAEEAATLRSVVAQDSALAELEARLARTIGLIGEAAGSLTEETTPPAEPLKLSSDRREKLLESFKVVRPKELVKRRKLNWRVRPRELAALAAMVIGLLAVGTSLFVNSESLHEMVAVSYSTRDAEATLLSEQVLESRVQKGPVVSGKEQVSGQLDPK